ncbi:MAG: DNA methyltransferase [Candidatus Eremiobacterota bacterium]
MTDSINIRSLLENFSLDKDLINSEPTKIEYFNTGEAEIPRYINEFWTSGQRKASSIHEVSYRACFKPQIPAFFINLFTEKGDFVYDPFSGRGTTIIEAGLSGRNIISNDINPLSRILSFPRFFIPDIKKLEKRLKEIPLNKNLKSEIDLSMFYHTDTEQELISLKNYLKEREISQAEDELDRWIRMVATNRLTGHSKGFFSVYTLPPNQAVSQESQIRINKKLNQKPEYRNTSDIILKKSKNLMKTLDKEQIKSLKKAGANGLFLCKDAGETEEIKSETVQLTVTSPPFLNIVHYSADNWLRCWFNSIDDKEIGKKITMKRTVEEWSYVMEKVFMELYRITRKNGWVAFEVGEVRKGKINLDEYIVPVGIKSGFKCEAILINAQNFTKTSNIWGVKNNNYGTNSNRIIIFQKIL